MIMEIKRGLENCRIIFLSPHLDDMIYSSAITIRKLIDRHCDITNFNFFTRSSWNAANNDCSIEENSNERLAEEQKMSQILGFKTLSMGLDDSSVRGLDAFSELTQECDPVELNKISEKFVKSLHISEYDFAFVPLAVGKHIDHKYVRETAERLFPQNRIIYYEDMPYAERGEDSIAYVPEGLKSILFEGDFSKKILDIEIYKSQTEKKNIEKMKKYGTGIENGKYVERIWTGDIL